MGFCIVYRWTLRVWSGVRGTGMSLSVYDLIHKHNLKREEKTVNALQALASLYETACIYADLSDEESPQNDYRAVTELLDTLFSEVDRLERDIQEYADAQPPV